MQENIKTGVVHGRFQPPHNGHMRYILSALKNTDHLIIGICTPEICTDEYAKQTGYPCTRELNPFTHTDRAIMITQTLDDEGIPKDTYSIIPFPSDYKDIHSIIPIETVFLVSHTGDIDSRKINYLHTIGYTTEIILDTRSSSEESGQKIRTSIKNNDTIWKDLVPKAVSEYIEKII